MMMLLDSPAPIVSPTTIRIVSGIIFVILVIIIIMRRKRMARKRKPLT